MESLRHYLFVTLGVLLSLAGVAHAQVPAMAARSLSLASPPNSAVPFASLTNPSIVPQTNGTITYCNNCSQATVCAAGGSGALAELVNNAWQCGLGTSTSGTVSISPGTAGQVGGYLVNGTTISPMPNIDKTNINGIVNPLSYGGADLGAQINNAMVANPNGTVIKIPPGNYTFGTTIQCPISGWTNYIIEGAGSGRASNGTTNIDSNTFLHYTGAGDAINQYITNTANQNSKGCELRDLTLDGNGAGANAVGVHFGGTEHTKLTNVKIQNFTGAGASGIRVENASGLWTERIEIHGSSFGNNQTGIWFHCDAGCFPSFSHEEIDAYLNVPPAGIGLKLDGTATTAGSHIRFNGNMNQGPPNTANTLIYVTGSSSAFATEWSFGLECNQSAGCIRFKVDAGSTIGGYVATSTNHLAPGGAWTDVIAGTNEMTGYATPAGYNSLTADSIVVGSPAHNGPPGGDAGPGTINSDFYFLAGKLAICGAAPAISGGGALTSGATSFMGSITNLAATGNVLTMGCSCPGSMQAVIIDIITGQGIVQTARTTNSVTFSATAAHAATYMASCN